MWWEPWSAFAEEQRNFRQRKCFTKTNWMRDISQLRNGVAVQSCMTVGNQDTPRAREGSYDTFGR
jgi:hypothetical protein